MGSDSKMRAFGVSTQHTPWRQPSEQPQASPLFREVLNNRHPKLYHAKSLSQASSVFPRYCPAKPVQNFAGVHRYKPVGTTGLLLWDALSNVLNPAPHVSTITRGADYIFTLTLSYQGLGV